jgi:hypothetical protein
VVCDAELSFEVGMTCFPHLVPAFQITVAILGDVFWQGMKREVGGDEGDVVKEGFVGMIGCMILQAIDGVIGCGDGGVVAFFVRRWRRWVCRRSSCLEGEKIALIVHV